MGAWGGAAALLERLEHHRQRQCPCLAGMLMSHRKIAGSQPPNMLAHTSKGNGLDDDDNAYGCSPLAARCPHGSARTRPPTER